MEDKFVGKRLDGRYEIHQLIGAGGMAHVYKAYDKEDDRWVAIKILKDEFADNNEQLRRFRNESKAIAMLSHPNIVKVYDVSFGDRIQYIVMEYISGITIKDYITRKGALSSKETLYFVFQILKALEHAHSKGVIHRDIKPQNIILLKDGTIKVTDFGIARVAQNETQTMTDKAFGSVHYIPPEQARGEYTNNKADIYSLGVMMYEMLTGKLPFEAETAVSVALMQVQNTAQKPRTINPDIPVGLEEITMKAMEKNPAMRFQSAESMLNDLEKFRQNPDITFEYVNDLQQTKQIEVPVDISNFIEKNNTEKKAMPVYNDNYEYEEEYVRSKRHAKGSMIITGIVSALLIALVAFGVYLVIDYTRTPQVEEETEVVVPNFIGKIYQDEIDGNILYEDFAFRIEPIVDESKAIGEIIRQSPTDGINVRIGKEITLYVVKEKEEGAEVSVPDLIGDTETNAYNALREQGFVPRVEEAYNEYTAVGCVISTEPVAGSIVSPNTEVVVYISKGPVEVPVAVPSLVGESLATAKGILESAGLKIGEVSYDNASEADKDVVTKSSPKAGEKLKTGSYVSVIVSSGSIKEKTVAANIPLPTTITTDLSMKIYLDGTLQTTVTVNPSLISSYAFNVSGKSGSKQVVVYLNDEHYIFGTANFDGAAGTFTIDNKYLITGETYNPDAGVTG